MSKFESHDFYCINCGNKGIPIARKMGNCRDAFHRKKLYCYHCKMDINHVEVRNDCEREQFKEMYENGEFKQEAEESICACRPSWNW